jgi:nitroreductase
MPTRRTLIAGGAGALVLAALGYRIWDRGVFRSGKGPAYAPWAEWRGHAGEGATRPLHAGILAANPHDTQPWQFALPQSGVTVFADRSRNLGSFDPFRREMHLGIGCAIENIALAAAAFGLSPRVAPVEGRLALSPGPAPVRAAEILLETGPAARSTLFDAIPARHTNRGPYRAQGVSRRELHMLAGGIESDDVRIAFIDDAAARKELGALIVEATARIIADKEMSADSAKWFRTGRREIEAHRDGIATDATGVSPLVAEAAKLLPDLDAQTSDRYWLSMTRDTHVATAPVLGLILVRDRLDMASALAAGRAWQRFHLAATVAGLAAQPLNQPVECMDRNQMLGRTDAYKPALLKFANASGWEPTFVFRLGYAERPALPSPRRPLDDVVIRAG